MLFINSSRDISFPFNEAGFEPNEDAVLLKPPLVYPAYSSSGLLPLVPPNFKVDMISI